ncbi:DNA-binding protein [Paraclostridium bifermentans]|uniref:DNA-binding protein n=1 Tax=Paraclostridium bifermentans TaxID=1490 RepID=A0AA44IGF5_PARBF|nr:DNA-binding protein [Paraclostridium bifermentans]MBN8047187.1 DNA-binding protein [Paraclostridium bifermentans]NME08741.1 DNA-binding protein [Paraclostridium bifermentans]UOW66420.1 DNA-binding protein [Paraclostridium bifermentans]
MTDKQKLDKFLKLQNKGISIDEIATQLDSDIKALRRFLNKNGYKSVKGKYVKKDDIPVNDSNQDVKQLELTMNSTKSSKPATKESKTSTKAKKNNTSSTTSKKSSKPSTTKSQKVYKSKPAKVNVSAEDLDKLCEVYDWYLSVKDIKSLKPKITKSKKDILIEECDMTDLKSTRVQVEKSTWEEFERLCSNSDHTKQEIITQAIKEFLKQYKNLI